MNSITVFGGSQIQAEETDYLAAQRLGSLLAQAGYRVITGGYIGAMEAVSRGAAEAGGYVIGVTCDEIEAWRPIKANRWVQEERRFPTLRARLFELIDSCDAAIALPGGLGTLAEITLMWNQMIINAIPARPLILVGAGWKAVLECFFEHQGRYIPDQQKKWVNFASNPEQAVDLVNTQLMRK